MAEDPNAPLFIKLSAISGNQSKTMYTVCNRKIDSFGKEQLN